MPRRRGETVLSVSSGHVRLQWTDSEERIVDSFSLSDLFKWVGGGRAVCAAEERLHGMAMMIDARGKEEQVIETRQSRRLSGKYTRSPLSIFLAGVHHLQLFAYAQRVFRPYVSALFSSYHYIASPDSPDMADLALALAITSPFHPSGRDGLENQGSSGHGGQESTAKSHTAVGGSSDECSAGKRGGSRLTGQHTSSKGRRRIYRRSSSVGGLGGGRSRSSSRCCGSSSRSRTGSSSAGCAGRTDSHSASGRSECERVGSDGAKRTCERLRGRLAAGRVPGDALELTGG